MTIPDDQRFGEQFKPPASAIGRGGCPLTPHRVAGSVLFVLLALVGWSLFSGGTMAEIVDPELTSIERVELIKRIFQSTGLLAPLAYAAFVTAEVVIAPIPGLMLYAPGGLIFGPFVGGLLAIIGNTLGAGIACGITRTLGSAWVERFFTREKIERVQSLLERRGGWLVFLLRLNPLTSNDLLSYAAGFTRIPVWQVMLATGCGMAPLCFVQSWLSDSLFTAFPQLIWPLLAACVVYVGIVFAVVRRL